jgi:hypothetical protein
VWPDQRERFVRLHGAMQIARKYPIPIAQGDGIAWAADTARPQSGSVTVLLHTVFVEHLPPQAREALRACAQTLAGRATPAAPFAWVRMEMAENGYETRVTRWPGGEELLVARSDGHAQDIRWY